MFCSVILFFVILIKGKVKVKLSYCLTKYHAMNTFVCLTKQHAIKTYGGVEL